MKKILTMPRIILLRAASVLRTLAARNRKIPVQQIVDPLMQGPRYHEGAITYNEYRGVRYNIEVEDPREAHGSRYKRRHFVRQHKDKKPWEK